jgi:hypothetical protein
VLGGVVVPRVVLVLVVVPGSAFVVVLDLHGFWTLDDEMP